MIKKIGSMCCVLMLMICMLLTLTDNAQAASQDPVLDGSYLTNENESIGYDTKITRGVDLLTGYSKCVRLGPGKIYAGGTTIAAHTVERVLVGVVIERAKKGDSAWSMYTGWQKENSNTDRAGSNRTLEVEGGYYYRVRSVHVANQDVSSSFTDGVYIE